MFLERLGWFPIFYRFSVFKASLNHHTKTKLSFKNHSVTFNYDIGRRQQNISSSIHFLFMLNTGYKPKISVLPLLLLEIGMKKTISLDFGIQPQDN